MDSIIFKTAKEVTNSLYMLNRAKYIEPMYMEIDYLNNFNIERFTDAPLSQSIPAAIKRIEGANANAASIIFPADIKENGKISSALVTVIHNNIKEFDVTIAIKYNFSDNKLNVSRYQLIDYNNLFEAELKEIEDEFVKGLLSPNYAMDIWVKQSTTQALR